MPACVLVFAGADAGCLSTLLSTAPRVSPDLPIPTAVYRGGGRRASLPRMCEMLLSWRAVGICAARKPCHFLRGLQGPGSPNPGTALRAQSSAFFLSPGDKKVLFPGVPCSVPYIPTSSTCPESSCHQVETQEGCEKGGLAQKTASPLRELACPSGYPQNNSLSLLRVPSCLNHL